MSATRRPRDLLRRLNPGQRRWGGAGLVAGVALASVLVSLAGKAASPSASSATDCGGPNRLTVATGADITAGSFRRDLIEEWNRTHTTQVTLVEVADRTDEERAEMAGRARLGSCAYDVFSVDVAWMAEFARSGYIREYPLGPKDAASFVGNVLRAGQVGGVQYAVPFVTDVPLLFYRSDVRLPTTTEQLWEYAGKYGGYAVQLGDYEGGTVNLLEAIRSMKGKVTDGERIVLDEGENGERVREALSRWHAMLVRGTLAHGAEDFSKEDTFTTFRNGFLARESKSSVEESSLQAFRDDDVAYMRNWPFAFHRLATDRSMYDDRRRPRFKIAALPGATAAQPGVGILGGFNLAISTHSDNPGKARMLIDFLTGHDAQMKLFACSGYPPVLESVYREYRDNPRTCAQLLASRGTGDGATTGAGGTGSGTSGEDIEITAGMLQDLADKIYQGIRKAEMRPEYPYYSVFSEVFRACARAVVTGDLLAEELDLARLADALRDARQGRAPEDTVASLAHCGKPEGRQGQ
ncbi:extracellular solute-binding protein [Streptosporangium sp. CA-135522]|uniref:extracellular solute-binding protein n=1 Tax=Streptosporangium sp. CA-135522 TaxID=3240072 RepID=UPI003D8A7CE9